MAKLSLKREVLNQTRERSNLTAREKAAVEKLLGPEGGKGSVSLPVQDVPLAFLKALLDDARLTPNQRAVIARQVYGLSGPAPDYADIYDRVVSSPIEFGSTFVLLGSKAPNCEI